MFEVKNISVRIGAKKILDDVSFTVSGGETVALVGPNGAGKSTLLKVMCGDVKSSSGEIRLENRRLKEWDYHELARKRAVLPQNSTFNFPFTAREVALLGRNPHLRGSESKRDMEIVEEALKLVEAEHLADQSFPTLSGGERQRIHLARVLAQIWERPKNTLRYLFLDEPTTSLDIAHQHLTLQTAREFAGKDTAVLIVLHDLNLAAQYADKILILQNGRKIAFDTPKNALDVITIREVFGIDAYITRHASGYDVPLIVPMGKRARRENGISDIKFKSEDKFMTTTTAVENDLRQAWSNLREENPHLRIRDAAEKLNVSEAELLATDCGENVTRLEPKFVEILQGLHVLGRVMALTRNDEVVHERKGEYKNVEVISGHARMGLAVNEDIDLRIFFANWHFAFAATSESQRGTQRSFQFFDSDGTAIHKVFLTDQSDIAEYKKLVEKYKHADQSRTVSVQPKEERSIEKPDAEIDVIEFQKAWANLRDTHDFFPMLRKFDIAREQALRLADREMARSVDAASFKFVLEEASKRELPIMVFVGNPGIIQIHTGTVAKVLEARGWFNVMDERFNLHIDQEKIKRAWVVKKPTDDGIVTSLELFNEAGENVALFFGKRKPGIPESEEWRDLIHNAA